MYNFQDVSLMKGCTFKDIIAPCQNIIQKLEQCVDFSNSRHKCNAPTGHKDLLHNDTVKFSHPFLLSSANILIKH